MNCSGDGVALFNTNPDSEEKYLYKYGDEDVIEATKAEENNLMEGAATDDDGQRRDGAASTPPLRFFRGHSNVRTVKSVSFFGMSDEYVMSGKCSVHVFPPLMSH